MHVSQGGPELLQSTQHIGMIGAQVLELMLKGTPRQFFRFRKVLVFS